MFLATIATDLTKHFSVVLRGSETRPEWMQRRSNASVFMERGTKGEGAWDVTGESGGVIG